MELAEIEQCTKKFSDARQVLAARIQILRDEQESAKRQRLAGIRSALVAFRATHDLLRDAINDSREQFAKPKTRILHGIKIGYTKQKGKLELGDVDLLIRMIERKFSDQSDTLIKTTKKPVVAALENLPAADLKRLGVTVVDDTDAIVIKPVDGDVDKLIDALINDDELEGAR